MACGSIDLLLVGRGGNGRSSTGNSILGKKVFEVKLSFTPERSPISKGSTLFDRSVLNVIDGPGCEGGEEDVYLDSLKRAFDINEQGFTAVLLILKFGNRFGNDEADAIQVLKKFLGKNIIKDYGICVFTQGDFFEAEETFSDWCTHQTGAIKQLFEECSFRCVLFDNKTKQEKVIYNQRKELIDLVTTLSSQSGTKYTTRDFLRAEGIQSKKSKTKQEKEEERTKIFLSDLKSKIPELSENLSLPETWAYKRHLQSLNLELRGHVSTLTDPTQLSDCTKLMMEALETQIKLKLFTLEQIDKQENLKWQREQEMVPERRARERETRETHREGRRLFDTKDLVIMFMTCTFLAVEIYRCM